MGKLRLKDWVQFSEILASVGVIVSLVFVAISIERGNSLTSAEISDDTYDALRVAQVLVLQDRTLLALTQKDLVELGGLDGTEKALYQEWVALYVDEWERLYSRQRDGLIQSENMEGWNEYFRQWFRRHVSPEIWFAIRWRHTTEGFRELLDAELVRAGQLDGYESESDSP